jgi:hypothetical protein
MVELPHLQSVYRLFGKENMVENHHLPAEGHDYGPSKRAGAYKFFAKHLGLAIEAVAKPDGTVDEADSAVEKHKVMHVFDAKHPLPAHAAEGNNAVEALLKGKPND